MRVRTSTSRHSDRTNDTTASSSGVVVPSGTPKISTTSRVLRVSWGSSENGITPEPR